MLKEFLARTRRALAQGDPSRDPDVPDAAEAFVLAYRNCLPPEQQLMFDRHFEAIARAAEELGPDAEPEDVAALARAMERGAH